MGKKISVLLAMVLVCMAAGTAFAGTTGVNNGALNTPVTIALEAMGAARNVTFLGGLNGPITYGVTQNITNANFVQVTFSGAAFAGNTVVVCKKDSGAANQVGVGTPTADATTYNFQLTGTGNIGAGNINAGDLLFLTTEAACNTTGVGSNFIFKASATAAAVNPTVTIAVISAGNIPVDPASTATLARVAAEFAVANTSSVGAHTVDYLGTPGTGINFTVAPTGATNATAGTANIVAFNRTIKNFGAYNGSGASNGAGLSVAGFVTLTDSLAWSGVSKVFINTQAALNCTDNAAANNIGVASPSGNVLLAIPAAAYNGFGGYATVTDNVPVNLCVVGNGTTALSPRTISVAAAVNATGVTGATSSSSSADVWTLNAYQTWIPWMSTASTIPTYCLINNGDTTRTASVILDVISSENSVVVSNQSMGTIAAKTSKLANFTAASAQLGTGTAISLSTLGTDARYSTKLTVTANPSNISVQCFQTDPSTGKRQISTLQNGGTWTY